MLSEKYREDVPIIRYTLNETLYSRISRNSPIYS